MIHLDIADISFIAPLPPEQGYCLVATNDHNIWICQAPLPLSPSSPRSKKPRLELDAVAADQQALFTASCSITWLVGLDSDKFCAFLSSMTIELIDRKGTSITAPMPPVLARALASGSPCCQKQVEIGPASHQLDPLFASHFGVNQKAGTLIGLDHGLVLFLYMEADKWMASTVAHIMFESIVGIHLCPLAVQAAPMNAMVVVGSKGTVHLYFKDVGDDQQAIQFREYTLPCNVQCVSFFDNASAFLVLGTNHSLHHVSLTTLADDISVETRQIHCLADGQLVQAIYQREHKIQFLLVTATNVQALQADLGSTATATVPFDPEKQRKDIEQTLHDLKELEERQADLDAYHSVCQRLCLLHHHQLAHFL
ncbi:hypothetical protein DM01DRAFT_1076357 [Hesseltinella vesiculosa]|uniref:Uncharacterized protein n=1 Tax=Hesseltinella vesiculosa TaxID=101127 RepID=A0A1X2GWD0_9FUNG|nr:hypothetical protein DM01DRAFT_1076357 [Hesseltinella vesiculosa]